MPKSTLRLMSDACELAGLADEFDAILNFNAQLEADLQERTDQYHLAHAKILSREAINEDLGKDYETLQKQVERLQIGIMEIYLGLHGKELKTIGGRLRSLLPEGD